jgi:hypothetical protein
MDEWHEAGAAVSIPNTENTPTPAAFVTLLEVHLLPRRIAFSRAAVQCFIASCWRLIDDRPDPAFGTARFLEGMDLMTPA